ncbi:MAG: cyclic pyranopterin monophosphate synthase MoaC [Acidobacteria bacterium]|nr:cyclic pyranopterin monophosphate synthase MoaC [Acidobacteriota bacterium]MXW36900.1 cyclic pyranopterin monophosphate synthase MoaC [Acidobacteriota bacterium]MYA47174.1 cyclic pyranopterin monophosphate synthase MoaC [Acidobacteriota bacterium]MYI37523.1 cyclic pyranopterin monophosphate synthase MoaC [Acidobacteriota bacterium]
MSSGGRPASPATLSHVDSGGSARMVDVGAKPVTSREAAAEAFVRISDEALKLARLGNAPKGSVLDTARLAGIQAAKSCAALIPLCHPLPLDHAEVSAAFEETGIRIVSRIRCRASTGAEMEALTAASVAALTVYDMLKAADRAMVIGPVRLLEKRGGASGDWRADGA